MFFLLFLAVGILADELVQVNMLWRHGDRTPMQCYPTDPYLLYWSQWPPGELTTIGMAEQYEQGARIKQRYIDQFGFINSEYTKAEINVQSSTADRCMESAASNMAAFYSGSKNTHPDNQGWPSQWTPIPVHTLDGDKAAIIDPGSGCPRAVQLMDARAEHLKFIEYQAIHEPLINKVITNSGNKDYLAVFDCVRCEKQYRNFTLPSWLTDDVYNQLVEVSERTEVYLLGRADFGVEDDVELLKLRGGPLLTEILNNMNLAQNGTDTVKMHVYSGHDNTITSLLGVLGSWKSLLGHKSPEYASTLAFELWNGSSGYYVKALYSANVNSSFRPITHLFNGCAGGDQCPFSLFYSASRPYLIKDLETECMKRN